MHGRPLGLTWCVALLLTAPVAAQQGTSEIGGRVADQQGAVLPGVAIVVTNEDTGVFREVVSSADGSYFVSQMVPGRYRITAKLEGFRSLERRGIVIEVGRTPDARPDAGCRRPRRNRHGHRRLAAGRSLVGRDRRPHLGAGAHRPAGGQSKLHGVCRERAGRAVRPDHRLPQRHHARQRAAGRREQRGVRRRTNIDDLRGSNVGGQARTANETIQEVQVLTNQFDAEFGRASGAVINAVTKSGTNQFSGSVFDFFTGKSGDGEGLLHGAERRPTEARREQDGVGRHGRRTDRPEQAALLREPRAARCSTETSRRRFPTVPNSAIRNTDDVSAWNTLLAHRSPDEREQHVGVPLAARVGAAIQRARRRNRDRREQRRRDRSRSDAGRHLDDGASRIPRSTPCGPAGEGTDDALQCPACARSTARYANCTVCPTQMTHGSGAASADSGLPEHERAGRRHRGLLAGRRLLARGHVLVVHPGQEGQSRHQVRRPGTRTSGSATRTTPTRTARMASVTTWRSMPADPRRIRSGSTSGCPAPLDYELNVAHLGAVRAGQVADEERSHPEPGRSLRPRGHPDRRRRTTPCSPDPTQVSGRQEQLRAAAGRHLESGRRGQVGRARRLRDVLRQDAARDGRQLPLRHEVLEVVHRHFPQNAADPGPRSGSFRPIRR